VAAFLDTSLASAAAQTYSNLEVIVVNNGSSDETPQIAQCWAEKDSRFISVRQTGIGVSAARNTGLAHAKGELIAFLDADDVWFPEKLARQMDLLKANPQANFLFSNYYLWDGNRDLGLRYRKLKYFPQGDMHTKLIYWNLFGASSVLIKRETIDQVGQFDLTLPAAEDWDLWLRIAEAGLKAYGIWEPLWRSRIWSGNASHQTIKIADCVVRVLEKTLSRSAGASWRHDVERSLQIARGSLELAKVRPLIETQPSAVPAAIWRAWRMNPRQIKWLLRWGCTIWPQVLGGAFTSAYAHRKLREKCFAAGTDTALAGKKTHSRSESLE
jgi:glycosyltransferase involved in cell wall biosynthesis